MTIVVLMRMAPDVVEELEVAPDGKALDTEYLRMTVNESDDHALEEALVLKERYGGIVNVLALEAPEVDEVLFAALARGADRAVKVSNGISGFSTRAAAHLFTRVICADPELAGADLVFTGVQAMDDLDALIAPVLAYALRRSYVGIVTKVTVDLAARKVTALKEYPGGVRGEFSAALPVVLGIQAAERPLRYVPVAKVRMAMKTQKIGAVKAPATAEDAFARAEVVGMAKPIPASHAEMIEGSLEAIAGKVADLLSGRGLL